MKVFVAIAVALIGIQHASGYPNLDYAANRTYRMHFFNSVFGALSGVDEGEITIKSLTGRLLPPEWQNLSSKRSNLLEIAKKLNLTKLVEAVMKVGLGGLLNHEGPFTLFGPTNEAFENAPAYCSYVPLKDVVKFHIALGAHKKSELKNNQQLDSFSTGRKVRINIYPTTHSVTASGKNVTSVDHVASNGVVHVLSDVICSLYKRSAAYELSRCQAFSVLDELLKKAALYDALDGEGPFTVFAPTDKAFSALSPQLVNYLKNNVTALKEVLLYHVVPDALFTPGLSTGQVKTLQGQSLHVVVTGGIHINDANIVLPDAAVSNGVVHAIDTVLLPKLLEIPAGDLRTTGA